MIKIFTSAIFSGDNFYPKKVEDFFNIKFYIKEDPNYKDNGLYSGGYAQLDYHKEDYPSSDFLNLIRIIKSRSKKFGIKEIILSMNIAHDYQCNFEFSSKLLKNIAELNITLSITTYEDLEQFE